MKITLDQDTLRQAVISHLQGVGVATDILKVDFRYTRVPYAVFAEVELSEAKLPRVKPVKVTPEGTVVEREVVTPVPLVDPDNLPPMELNDTDDSAPIESSTPNGPLFGD